MLRLTFIVCTLSFYTFANNLCERSPRHHLINPVNRLGIFNWNLLMRDEAGGYLKDSSGSFVTKPDDNSLKIGVLGLGYCWWHSLFELKATYVASFDDIGGVDVHTKKEARRLIRNIIRGKITKIKNFENLRDFSIVFESELRKELSRWQLKDMIFFRWFPGLKGKSKMDHSKLYKRVTDMYREIQSSKAPLFQILQTKGLSSHAWIVLDITKYKGAKEKYEITATDSNFPFLIKSTIEKDSGKENLIYDPVNFHPSQISREYQIRLTYKNYNYDSFTPQNSRQMNKEILEARKNLKRYCKKIKLN